MEKRIRFDQKVKLLDNQKEKLLDKNIFPINPIPNPIRERSMRLDNMQDGRNTSRSQEISVNSFCEELNSSERSGRLVQTSVLQARSSEDRKSLNVEQTHERTVRLVATFNPADAKDSSRVRSYHESDTFNVEDEELRKRIKKPLLIMTRVMNQWWWIKADMDFRIPGLPHSVVKRAQSTIVRQLIQKIENHPDRHALQQDLR